MTSPRLPDSLLRDPALAAVFDALERDGDRAMLVGGSVRNALLEREATDVDIATTAVPDVVVARAKEAGIKCVPTGIEHGTVTLVLDGRPFEVTTLREDVDTDGRRASVRFGHDFSHDARRRDFTINALYADRDGVIHDFVGGRADLEARRVRFIGDAVTRIREDYLRILRFFRFHADFAEGPLDAEGLAACIAEKSGLERLSRERVRAELMKLLAARRAAETVSEMDAAGLLAPLLGGRADPDTLDRLLRIRPQSDGTTRLFALASSDVSTVPALQERLRLSNEEAARLAAAARATADFGDDMPAPRPLKRIAFRRGRDAAGIAVLVAAARRGLPECPGELLAALAEAPERSPFTGSGMIALGLAPGPSIGHAIAEAEAAWIDADFPKDGIAVSEIARKAAEKTLSRFDSSERAG